MNEELQSFYYVFLLAIAIAVTFIVAVSFNSYRLKKEIMEECIKAEKAHVCYKHIYK